MSHTTKVQTTLTDSSAIIETARRLGLECECGVHQLYDKTTVEGYAVKLQGWLYPIIIKEDGSIAYDNYGGQWGNEAKLQQFQQEYAATITERELAMAGFRMEREMVEGNLVIRAVR